MGLIDNFRGTWLPTLAKVVIITLLAVTVYNLASFGQSSRDAVNRSFASSASVNFYGLSDQLADPEQFEQYRSSPENIRKIARFYDDVRADDRLKVLSIFDQSLPIADFTGDESFEYGYGTEIGTQGPHDEEGLGTDVVNVKSVQMNKTAFYFFNLKTESGTAPNWDEVDYAADSIPILLGADYRDVYEIGDTLKGNYYSQIAEFRVVGFLESDSSVFYQNTINFFLDDYVVIPYPPTIADFPESESYFYGILAFAMINANVAASTDMSSDAVLSALQAAAARSGFHQFALIGVPAYITQFGLVRSLITDNLGLLVAIEIVLALGAAVVVAALTHRNHRRRGQRVRTQWALGWSPGRLERTAIATVVVEYAMVGSLLALVIRLLPNHDPGSGYLLSLGVVVMFVGDAVWQRWLLKKTISEASRNTA
ncbi:hypothetical protein [Frondihabitans sp. Leaf304]|uniref:hypothetical protein n=1 Tax=Frondihabitans sp. Leaf304 TaxID=1736329 RepID=UPI0006FA34C0|nr:hypothetical protein [Frondihabitans sp. Leaf304]KQQ28854.1 hypothetical protein ASF54_09570 [Frondihabitans sp. Leaf304]